MVAVFNRVWILLCVVGIVALIVVPGAATFYMEELGRTDLYGSDIEKVTGISPSQCSDRCLTNSLCKSATYVQPNTLRGPGTPAECWLKNTIPARSRNLVTTSYIKMDTDHPTGWGCIFEPLSADFTATPLQGRPPLTVKFTDTSVGSYSWHWDFDDDGDYDSYDKNPSYTYNEPGTYTVKLTVGGGACADFSDKIRSDYIIVEAQYGTLDVSSTPAGARVYVDSDYKGMTPTTIADIEPGSHTVVLKLTGYNDQTKSLIVTADETSNLSVVLEPKEGSPCDDGDKCTVNDIVKDKVCTPGTPLVCDDKNPNTVDTCNPATGACVYTIKAEGSSCEDGNLCTVNDVMKGGVCTPGTPLVCNDGDSKTADTCTPQTGCVYTPLKPMTISFTSSPSTVEPDKQANLIITVLGSDSAPVEGATVKFSQPTGAVVSPPSGITNSSGMVLVPSIFIASEEGTYTISADVAKDGYLSGSQTVSITVKSVFNLMTFLPFIIILVIILVIVLFLLTRNRLQLIVKTTSVPADGRSTIPIKIQFANGLGSLKNQSVDRDVNLTATSGTIKPVLISRGKAFIETTLTASREVGKVKITAQYGNQQAESMVTFTIEGGTIEISAEPKEIPADGKSSAAITLKLKDKGNIPFSFLDEKTIQVTTTLGTIQSPLKIQPHSTEVKTTLLSGTASGIATIIGMVDQLKGETTVKIGAAEERHCQRCGTRVSLEAIICPKCKQSPTLPAPSTKECPFCKEVLPKDAVYCNKCGRAQA